MNKQVSLKKSKKIKDNCKPEIHYVFIDTCIYRQYHFMFDHEVFKSIKRYSDHDVTQLLITNATIAEVRKNIAASLDESYGKLNKHAILKHIAAFKRIFIELDEVKYKKQVNVIFNRFKKFTDICNIKTILIDNVKPMDVLNLYYEGTAPFAIKKHEIPDAFVLLALARFAEELSVRIHIVSCDDDMKDFCKYNSCFTYHSSAENFLHFIAEQHEAPKKIDYIYTAIKQNEEEIIRYVKETLVNLEFEVADFPAGTCFIENLEVNSVKIDKINIINIEKEDCLIELTTTVKLFFDLIQIGNDRRWHFSSYEEYSNTKDDFIAMLGKRNFKYYDSIIKIYIKLNSQQDIKGPLKAIDIEQNSAKIIYYSKCSIWG